MSEEVIDNGGEDTADKIREGLKTKSEDNKEVVDEVVDNEDKTDKKPTDAEAKLLKEVMKHKAAAKKAAEDLKAINDKFAGLDIDEVKALIQKREEDEKTSLEKKGEYERLLAKQREAADAKLKEATDRATAADLEKNKLLSQIEDLTTGQAFSNSKFVTDKLTLTPNKAKALYKSHFEFVDGKMVGYDKPKGESDRTMIVGSDGEAVGFDEALTSIINSDPDKEWLIKADIKSGAGSKGNKVDGTNKKVEYVDTTDKIMAGLEALSKKK